jgi:phage regulator Rha-like protein
MKQKNQLSNLIVSMTSLEIAELVESRHDDVKRTISRLSEKLIISLPPLAVVKIKRERRVESITVFSLCKRDSLIVVAQLCPEFTALLVDRWDYLEKENELLRNELALKEQARSEARLEYKPMTTALLETRKALGKDTQHFHYSNEANLINIIVMGSTAKKLKEDWGLDNLDNLRDELTPQQIAAVQNLQKVNTSLIDVGLDYEIRKEKLKALFSRKWSNLLVEEHIRLEA